MLGDYEAEINVYFFRYEKVFVTDQTEGLNTRKSVDPKDEDEGRPKITKGPKFLKPTSVEKPRVEERRRNADRLNLYSSTREDGMLV